MMRTLLFSAALITSTAGSAASASKFLSDAIKGDNSETRLGQLIGSRGSSAAVRSFGHTLTNDHSKARVEASAVARRMHVSTPTAMMPEAKTEYAKLQHLHGASFDREVKRYMIKDHEKDISDFEKQVKNGDRQTADLAKAQLPTLRKHLEIAKSLPG